MSNKYTPKRQPIYVIGPSIAYLPLTRGSFALIEVDDAEWLMQWNWTLGGNGYAYRNIGKGVTRGRTITMHVAINLPDREYDVDHKNRSKLDNRSHNLRQATDSQNLANCGMYKNNKSGYPGVFYLKDRNRWVSLLESKHVGYFATKKEAIEHRERKVKELYGEFAAQL